MKYEIQKRRYSGFCEPNKWDTIGQIDTKYWAKKIEELLDAYGGGIFQVKEKDESFGIMKYEIQKRRYLGLAQPDEWDVIGRIDTKYWAKEIEKLLNLFSRGIFRVKEKDERME